ncbi:MAG: hypothetical protein AAFN09_17335 [Pseudomonadota bacterium]
MKRFVFLTLIICWTAQTVTAQTDARSYDVALVTDAYQNEIINFDEAVIRDFARWATLPVEVRAAAINRVNQTFHPGSSPEMVLQVPIYQTVITAIELASRGILSDGLNEMNESLLALVTEQQIHTAMLQTLSDEGRVEVQTDADGTVTGSAPYNVVARALIERNGREAYEAFFTATQEQYREFTGNDLLGLHAAQDFRHADFIISLTAGFVDIVPDRSILGEPESHDAAYISRLRSTIATAAPCIYDTRNDAEDDLDCGALGAEIARLLTTAP